MITFTVPGQPTAKGRPRFVRATGRSYTPTRTVNAEAFVKTMATEAMSGRAPLDGPLGLKLLAVFDVPASWSRKKQEAAIAGAIRPTGRPDLDNLIKLYGDACNGIVWRDDAIIVRAEIEKRYGPAPGVTIEVAPIDRAPALPLLARAA